MVRNEGFEPPIGDSESPALPLGELRKCRWDIFYKNKKVSLLYKPTFLNQIIFLISFSLNKGKDAWKADRDII